jgi:transcriptional regulator with XRE-family HTH domain
MATRLGRKLRERRKEFGLSLDALAAKAKLSKSYLWELENRDDMNPSAEKLGAIANILDTSVSFLIEDESEKPDDRHIREAFFRDFDKLEPEQKRQLHDILKVFKRDTGD